MLTPLQSSVLKSLFQQSGIGSMGFYLTGGTALSAFHLHHRLSEDLDLFTRVEDLDFSVALRHVRELASSFGKTEVSISSPGFLRLHILGDNGRWDRLKLEFAKDVPVRLAPPLVLDSIIIDSQDDIAANKLSAIMGRDKPRDLFDLYTILKNTPLTLETILKGAARKDALFEQKDALYGFVARIRQANKLSSEEFKREVHPVHPGESASEMARFLNVTLDDYLHQIEEPSKAPKKEGGALNPP